jgi:hypothetical protein
MVEGVGVFGYFSCFPDDVGGGGGEDNPIEITKKV